MNKCKKCGVYITDKTAVCPLCRMILTEVDGEEEVNMYPNILQRIRIRTRVLQMVTLVLFLVQILLVVLNISFATGIIWSAITGMAFLYALITVYDTVFQRKSLARKIVVQTVSIFVLLLTIDLVLGFRGWSLEYGVPCEILLLDGAVILFMILDFRNWQSYLLIQIFSLLISGVWGILWLCKVLEHGLLVGIAFGVTLLLFCFSMLLGSQKAWSELQRRFYI